MNNKNERNRNTSLFQSTWSSPKRASSQVNGQTQQTQSGIILSASKRS